MSAFERSTIWISRVAIGVSIVVGLAVCAQWWEMHTGGIDTHALAIAADKTEKSAEKSAQASRDFADSAEKINGGLSDAVVKLQIQAGETHDLAVSAGQQADRTRDLADRMKDQADKTKIIAEQAVVQSNAAKSAAETAASQLELAERPWVDAQMLIDGPFEFNVNGVNVHIKFQLVNTGHSPALATVISPRMNSEFSAGLNDEDVLNQACNDAMRISATMPHFGVTLFPNHPQEENISFGMGKDDLDKATKLTHDQIVWPNLVICIGYRSTFSNKVYHTDTFSICTGLIPPI